MRISAFIVFLLVSISISCTGYAVYTDQAWYGMNFDYPPESEIRFTVSDYGDMSIFTMDFYDNDMLFWIPTVGMNDHGLFSSLQYQCPMIEGASEPEEGQLYLYQLFNSTVFECVTLEEVEPIIDSVELINLYDLTLHTLIADTRGNALIAEAGDGGNCITSISGDWIVMTNFKNSDFTGTPPEDIVGVGDERYRRAFAYLEGNYSSFDLTEAIGTLEAAVNSDSVWGTKASMAFDPLENNVYIAVGGDFDRIWRMSIDNQTISTWSGFEKERSAQVDENGITVSEMRVWE